jgi:DNA-directed RNA polymerase beta subunit
VYILYYIIYYIHIKYVILLAYVNHSKCAMMVYSHQQCVPVNVIIHTALYSSIEHSSAHTQAYILTCLAFLLCVIHVMQMLLCTSIQIRTTLPYIRTDVPIVLIFRALGFVNDKTILEHIVYDFRYCIIIYYIYIINTYIYALSTRSSQLLK